MQEITSVVLISTFQLLFKVLTLPFALYLAIRLFKRLML